MAQVWLEQTARHESHDRNQAEVVHAAPCATESTCSKFEAFGNDLALVKVSFPVKGCYIMGDNRENRRGCVKSGLSRATPYVGEVDSVLRTPHSAPLSSFYQSSTLSINDELAWIARCAADPVNRRPGRRIAHGCESTLRTTAPRDANFALRGEGGEQLLVERWRFVRFAS